MSNEIRALFPADTKFEQLPEPEGERGHYARSKWPKGPWDNEPYDRITWVDPDWA